ncbi:MAG: hypothetical protein VCA36_03410, partial [Opitutales bacterium]
MNILTLHRLGNPAKANRSLRKQTFFLRDHCPEHNFVYHEVSLPFPDYLKEVRFHAIVLDTTFMGERCFDPALLRRRKRDYAFVKDSGAVLLAFPQDDYDCHEITDQWMCEWGVDLLFPVIPDRWDLLYPRYHKQGEIRLWYTGFVDDALLDYPATPFSERPIDIGYRAKKLFPIRGRVGETKWRIGRDVKIKAARKDLRISIELFHDATGFLKGDAWLDFINDCKFTLGSNSGSSLLDPVGDIARSIRRYLAKRPSASFEEVEEHCFESLDGLQGDFTAVSPRVLEASLLRSAQILVVGDYSGLIRPWEHYLPIKPDASDFESVYEAMSDIGEIERMIERCHEAVADCQNLRYSSKAREILDLVREKYQGPEELPDAHLEMKTLALVPGP